MYWLDADYNTAKFNKAVIARRVSFAAPLPEGHLDICMFTRYGFVVICG
jgi:hypothetical protein